MLDLISIVIPCYNEQEVLPTFYGKISKVILNMEHNFSVNFEILFVDEKYGDHKHELNEHMKTWKLFL